MTTADSTPARAQARTPRLALGTKVFIGLVLGVLAGMFAGERVAFLGVVGRGYIQLLQITVIPYVAVSLITALGRLTLTDAKNLGLRGGLILLALWAIGLALVMISPLAYPDWPSASFFSASEIESAAPIDFLQLYIPANPFFSLANSIVPAIVVFCTLVGLSLTTVSNKDALLEPLTATADALMGITAMISRLAPYGIFALTAHAAGTIAIDELSRLQVYIATYTAISLLLSFWVLPALITALTPVRYGEIFTQLREPLIAAFATGSLLVVLPMLAGACKSLLETSASRNHPLDLTEARASVDVLLPAAFNFPTLGALLSLMFLLFGGWLIGVAVSGSAYPNLAAAGLASLFGGTTIAIPFLLDLLELPQDLTPVFFAVDVINSRFGTLLAAMHVTAIGLIGAFALQARIHVRPLVLLRILIVSVVVALALLGGVRAFYTHVIVAPYTKDRTLREMHLLTPPRPARLVAIQSPTAASPVAGVAEIRRRGVLRACFFPDDYPAAFFNDESPPRLVGFDIDMTHAFARTLGLSIEFVRAETLRDAADSLRRGACDVHMSGMPITASRTESFLFSAPVLRSSIGLIVRDHQRDEFRSWDEMRQRGASLRIGLPDDPDALSALHALLPQAASMRISARTDLKGLLASGAANVDAIAEMSEEAAAWTLLYPQYTLVVPKPVLFVPIGYAVAPGNDDLRRAIDAWIIVEQAQGGVDTLYRYWMLGQTPQGKHQHRWSVLRDVLHWVE